MFTNWKYLFFIFYTQHVEEDQDGKVIEENVTVDNTISPENTTQGVFLEVKRIHKKRN